MLIIADALPEHLRLAALATFPDTDWPWWHRYESGKLATVDPSRIPTACQMALQQLALVVDPSEGFIDFDLYGAGLHYMPPGTRLGRHLDASHHPQRPWRRVASCVYFLEDNLAGELVVDTESVTPKANTAAIFPADTWHEVRACWQPRRTLSLFVWQIDTGEKTRTSAEFSDAKTA